MSVAIYLNKANVSTSKAMPEFEPEDIITTILYHGFALSNTTGKPCISPGF